MPVSQSVHPTDTSQETLVKIVLPIAVHATMERLVPPVSPPSYSSMASVSLTVDQDTMLILIEFVNHAIKHVPHVLVEQSLNVMDVLKDSSLIRLFANLDVLLVSS